MQQFFGPLRNSDIATVAADRFAHETHNLPKAYEGRNKFLMATIDFLITKDDDWYTRVILPWEFTEELHVAWNIWRFNKTMMDYEPHQGVPRYVSQESETHSASMVRRGLAFIIEHGFYQTELGRQHYLMNLRQITEAVHETVYYGVIHALLGADNHYKQWQLKHGAVNNQNINRIMRDDRLQWACVQKDVKGLYILDAEIKDRMRRAGIEPTAWVFPGKMAIYASMVPEYFTEYSRGGIQAPKALEAGARRFDSFRGLPVYETRPFDVDFIGGGGVEPLTKLAQIGEYYSIEVNENFARHGVKIFNMDTDRFEKIGLEDVRQGMLPIDMEDRNEHNFADLVGWPGGENMDRDMSGLAKAIVDCDVGLFADYADRLRREVGELGDRTTRACMGTPDWQYIQNAHGAGAGVNADVTYVCCALICVKQGFGGGMAGQVNIAMQRLYNQGVPPPPAKILLMRPFMTYRMGSAILCRAGVELGQTFHGHHDFQLTDDIIHKVHIGHYTFYSKSIVRSAKHMYIAENVFCQGYVSGENLEFIKSLADMEEDTGSRKSLICTVILNCGENLNNPLSLTGDLTHDMATIGVRHGLGNYPGSDRVARQLDLENHINQTDQEFDEMRYTNTVMFRGCVKHYNVAKQAYSDVTINTGHWGPNVYDGVGAVREGAYAHMQDCCYYKCQN